MYQGHPWCVLNTNTCVGHVHFQMHLFLCTFRLPLKFRCSWRSVIFLDLGEHLEFNGTLSDIKDDSMYLDLLAAIREANKLFTKHGWCFRFQIKSHINLANPASYEQIFCSQYWLAMEKACVGWCVVWKRKTQYEEFFRHRWPKLWILSQITKSCFSTRGNEMFSEPLAFFVRWNLSLEPPCKEWISIMPIVAATGA